MNYPSITRQLQINQSVFEHLLSGLPEEMHRWKPKPDKWCLLEIVCHLYDEEREDFRARVKRVLEDPSAPLTPIDPPGWVKERNYMQQNYNEMLGKLLAERTRSVNWLESLEDPQWQNTHQHPKLGPMSAKLFLANWLAHDYLHFRQITRLKFNYLKAHAGQPLDYAGEW